MGIGGGKWVYLAYNGSDVWVDIQRLGKASASWPIPVSLVEDLEYVRETGDNAYRRGSRYRPLSEEEAMIMYGAPG